MLGRKMIFSSFLVFNYFYTLAYVHIYMICMEDAHEWDMALVVFQAPSFWQSAIVSPDTKSMRHDVGNFYLLGKTDFSS